MLERSSAPQARPGALAQRFVEAIVAVRRRHGWGPHRIAWELGRLGSTVYGVRCRLGRDRLKDLDRTTRCPIRYVRDYPSELAHLYIKALGASPQVGANGSIPAGRPPRPSINRPPGTGLSRCTWLWMTPRAEPTARCCPMSARHRGGGSIPGVQVHLVAEGLVAVEAAEVVGEDRVDAVEHGVGPAGVVGGEHHVW